MISSEIMWQFYDFSKNDLLSVNTKVKPTHCFIYFLTDFPPFLRWCQCKRRKNYFSLQIWWQIKVLFFIQDFFKKKVGFLWLDLFSLERLFQYTLKWNVLDLIAVNICFIFTAQNLLEIKLRLMCAWVLVEWNVQKICYTTIIDRRLEKVSSVRIFTHPFANTSTERSTISCNVAMALCCHSQFPTAPEDKGAVVFQLSQNEPQWLIKSRYDLL